MLQSRSPCIICQQYRPKNGKCYSFRIFSVFFIKKNYSVLLCDSEKMHSKYKFNYFEIIPNGLLWRNPKKNKHKHNFLLLYYICNFYNKKGTGLIGIITALKEISPFFYVVSPSLNINPCTHDGFSDPYFKVLWEGENLIF